METSAERVERVRRLQRAQVIDARRRQRKGARLPARHGESIGALEVPDGTWVNGELIGDLHSKLVNAWRSSEEYPF